MAKAKIGGTSGKKRGYVGNTLYQLTRDANGELVQLQRAKELSREYTNTDQQALNRMLMGTIEMAMATCKGYVKDTFQDAKTQKIAYQMFSAYNYALIKEDARAHWNSGYLFDYPSKSQKERRGGCFLISDGSLNFEWPGTWNGGSFYEQRIRFRTDLTSQPLTMKAFRELNGFGAGDTIKFFAFCPDFDTYKGKMHTFYVNVASGTPDDLLLTSANFSQVFSVYGNVLASGGYDDSPNVNCAYFDIANPAVLSYQKAYAFAAVLIRWNGGRKQISTNRMKNANHQLATDSDWQSPFQAYNYSWNFEQ